MIRLLCVRFLLDRNHTQHKLMARTTWKLTFFYLKKKKTKNYWSTSSWPSQFVIIVHWLFCVNQCSKA